MTSQELLSLLQELPSLQELQILSVNRRHPEGYQPIADEEIYRKLTYNTSSDTSLILAPKLQAITLRSTLLIGNDELVDMIHSRLKPPAALTRLAYVKLQYTEFWETPSSSRDWLRSLEKKA
jgi:hypothetical protein